MPDAARQDLADRPEVLEDVPDYRIRPFSLRFADERVEERFIPTHLVRALPIIRIFLLAAAALYASFGVLDMYAIPHTLTEAWLIRYAGVCPLLLAVVGLTYTPFFLRWSQPLLGGSVFISGFGIILM